MKPLKVVLSVGVLIVLFWTIDHYFLAKKSEGRERVYHGNVERREIRLSFEVGGKVEKIFVEEGSYVEEGQLLAELDKSDLLLSLEIAKAQLKAAQLTLQLLEKGPREEEVEKARANLKVAEEKYRNAQKRYERAKRLASSDATSKQNLDDARTNLEIAKAQLKAAQLTLQLLEKGPREEEVEKARANLKVAELKVKELQKKVEKASLVSPTEGVITAKLAEEGELVTPYKPVLIVAPTHEKKVRFFVSEPELTEVKEGREVEITTDSGVNLKGKICFVSPEAEFTPQNVETDELRPTLVYMVKACVYDPQNSLRAGMPVEVILKK